MIGKEISEEHNFHGRIRAFLGASGAGAVATILILAWWFAEAANQIARENSVQLVKSVLQSRLQGFSVLTADYALWDEAFEWVTGRDDDATFANLGSGATDSPGFDTMSFVSHDGTPIYAYRSGDTGSDTSWLDPETTHHILQAVSRVQPFTGTEFTSYENIVSGVERIDGHLSFVAATRVQPFDPTGLGEEDFPVMIGSVRLAEAALARISQELLIEDLQFAASAESPSKEYSSLPVQGIDGTPIAWLEWRPPRPGDQLLSRVAPTLLFASALIFLAALAVSRASAAQTSKFLNERFKARTDALTGLMNRAGLTDCANSTDVDLALRDGLLAIAYVDLDGFKSLNDSEGHDAGDRALRITASRLRRSVRDTDHVVRMGGDEFVVVILDEDPHGAVTALTERLEALTAEPISFGERSYVLAASVGVALSEPGETWDEVMARADAAMYRSKRSRRGHVTIDQPGARAVRSQSARLRSEVQPRPVTPTP